MFGLSRQRIFGPLLASTRGGIFPVSSLSQALFSSAAAAASKTSVARLGSSLQALPAASIAAAGPKALRLGFWNQLRFSSSFVPQPLPQPLSEANKFHPSIPTKAVPREWKPEMKRVGAVAVKAGMTALWDQSGERHPVTVLQLQHTQVIQVRTKETDGFCSLQVGTGRKSTRNLKAKVLNHFAKYGVPAKRYVREFPVSEEGLLPPGFEIRAAHFVPAQFVDIQGVSIGKGFQGGMKRWGFGGLPASHGVSVSHRSIGSTGNRQDPGRVWRGKKMPGRMGNDRITVLNLKVLKVDTVLNLVYVRGHVPGHRNGFVRIRDSLYKPFPSPPPFPSYIPNEASPLPRELVAPEFVPRPLTQVNNDWVNAKKDAPSKSAAAAPAKGKAAATPGAAPAPAKDKK